MYRFLVSIKYITVFLLSYHCLFTVSLLSYYCLNTLLSLSLSMYCSLLSPVLYIPRAEPSKRSHTHIHTHTHTVTCAREARLFSPLFAPSTHRSNATPNTVLTGHTGDDRCGGGGGWRMVVVVVTEILSLATNQLRLRIPPISRTN